MGAIPLRHAPRRCPCGGVRHPGEPPAAGRGARVHVRPPPVPAQVPPPGGKVDSRFRSQAPTASSGQLPPHQDPRPPTGSDRVGVGSGFKDRGSRVRGLPSPLVGRCLACVAELSFVALTCATPAGAAPSNLLPRHPPTSTMIHTLGIPPHRSSPPPSPFPPFPPKPFCPRPRGANRSGHPCAVHLEARHPARGIPALCGLSLFNYRYHNLPPPKGFSFSFRSYLFEFFFGPVDIASTSPPCRP